MRDNRMALEPYMNLKTALWIGIALTAASAFAQQVPANPAPGCSATPADLALNKKVVMSFFDPNMSQADRVALADPTYKQHNPADKKIGDNNHLGDYDQFVKNFGPGGRTLGRGGQPGAPQGNPLEIVTAECDIVTVIHKNYRQDPTAEPGKFYEVFTFDTYRVKNGKLTEHWDGAVINPPAPAGASASGAGRGQ